MYDEATRATKELYERLINTSDIDGTFSFDGVAIQWHRHCEAWLCIEWDYIGFVFGQDRPYHWHPNYDYNEIDKFYDELVRIGKKGNILVVRKCLIGTEMFFVGSAEEYYTNKKLYKKLGKKYIFGDLKDGTSKK